MPERLAQFLPLSFVHKDEGISEKEKPNRRVKAPRNTAIKLALNPKVQVVAPAMHKAFRQADLHTNICRVASGYYDIGSRTLLIGKCSRELSDSDYIVPYIAMKGVRNECRISALPKDTGMIDLISYLQLS